MQNGFVANNCMHIVPIIKELIENFNIRKQPIVFTKFFNHTNSQYRRWIHWNRLSNKPETDIIDELESHAHKIITKNLYTPFNPEFDSIIIKNKIDKLFICGVATESCVLKTAVDAFERNIKPIVVIDACYSHAGETAHKAGLLTIERNIGSDQLIKSHEILHNPLHI